jgi:hypothetical protein
MSNSDTVSYVCSECGYTNVWTRDEIRQRGEQVVYKGEPDARDQEELFSLPCKNPKLFCRGRMLVAVPIVEK